MGVNGLWKITGSVARPVKLESLHGKRLAVDASIWIYHFLKAVRDKEGNALPNSHIVGFFRRICKLLFHGILPVFVFDGDAPLIKKQTIANRNQRRRDREEDASRTASKLLSLQLQKLAEEEINKTRASDIKDSDLVYFDELSMTTEERESRRKTQQETPKKFRRLDPYHLPDQPIEISRNDPRVMSEEELERYAQEYRELEDVNLLDTSDIDFSSPEFQALPINIQYQLLNTARLRSRLRMGYSKEQLDQIFPDRLEFSKFQIERVKERNMLTQKLMNLNGMNDHPSLRVAGEKDTSYVLRKNESGWTLALEETSMSNPIDIRDEGENEVDEDDWEDVPIVKDMPVYLTHHKPLSESLNERLKFLNQYAAEPEDEDKPLFLMPEEEEIDLERNPAEIELNNDDHDLQRAIQLSMENENDVRKSTDQDQVGETIGADEQSQKSSKTPFIFENDDQDLMTIINSLPKLPIEETSRESSPPVPKKITNFNMGNSIFARKRSLVESSSADLSTGEAQAGLNSKKTKIDLGKNSSTYNDFRKQSITSEMLEDEGAKGVNDDKIKSEDDNINIVDIDYDLGNRSATDDVFENAVPDNLENSTEDDHNLSITERQKLDIVDNESRSNEPSVNSIFSESQGLSEIVSESYNRYKSPEWDLSSPESPRVPPEIPLDERTIGILDENSVSDEERHSDDEEQEEDTTRLEEEEEEDIVRGIAKEVEEHARFASEINPNSFSSVDYDSEIRALKTQQRHDRRDADQVSINMVKECQELLARFGIPYVTAPMEAEAQCAELLQLGLVDGIITDDSDVFLFGASRVYKNMFNQSKFVECYLKSDIEQELGLTTKDLIDLAHLLGSDYTSGLRGIGPVTAKKIIDEFKSEQTLINFRDWWNKIQMGDRNADLSTTFKKQLKRKSKKLFLPPSFPSPAVDDAYLHPTVDDDTTEFVWGTPDLDRIRGFLMSNIGWSKERADEVLVPLLRTMNLKKQSLAFTRSGFSVLRKT
ncbi:hypothetical protein V1511DRAFT_506372 [Dipodascopsis uninucleata]